MDLNVFKRFNHFKVIIVIKQCKLVHKSLAREHEASGVLEKVDVDQQVAPLLFTVKQRDGSHATEAHTG